MRLCMVACSFVIFSFSCGKKKEDTTTSNSVFPKIEFTFPSSATTLASSELTNSGTNILSEWSKRADNIITYLNLSLERLNNEKLEQRGTVTFKNAAGKTVKVTVGDTSGDATYSKTATVCIDSSPMLYMLWNADSSRVYALRDFAVENHTSTTQDVKVEVTYTKSSASSIQVKAYGKPWVVPSDVSSSSNGGEILADNVTATKDADNVFSVVGVNAWESSRRTSANKSDAFTGDVYFGGRIIADGSGSFVAYRVFNTNICTASFSESNSTAPGWCFLGTISTTGAVSYSINSTTIANQWTDSTLKPLGIAKASEIKHLEFPTSVNCGS